MSTAALEKNLFNLKFTVKQLQMNAKKSLKEETTEKLKIKKSIQQGNGETAKIYAENAIRKRNEHINYLRLAARIDAVAARVQTAISMKKVTHSMASVVGNMDRAMTSMNIEKITQVMDKFESQFEDLDVQSQYMEGTISNSTAVVTPADQVLELLQKVADEHNLDLHEKMGITASSVTMDNTKISNSSEVLSLDERLAKLRSVTN